jgi:hypothetical protein
MRTAADKTDLHNIVTWGLVFALGLVVSILALEIGFQLVQRRQFERKVVEVAPAELLALRASQQAVLQQGVRWVDGNAGLVGMPIEMAMDAVVRRHGGDGE